MLYNIEVYTRYPSLENWGFVQAEADTIGKGVDDILNHLKDDSKLVKLNFFDALLLNMKTRESALLWLTKLPRPSTEPEIEALRNFGEKYIRLVDTLTQLRWSIRDYLNEKD